MSKPPNYLDYVDGLAQVKIITLLNNGKDFEISKKFLKSVYDKIKITKQRYPHDDRWTIFNTSIAVALQDKIYMNLAQQELTNYTQTMMSMFAACGVYRDVFGDDWEKYLDRL